MKMMKIKRIVVGMSGGVDSSVAALLLQRKGFDVVGLYMKNWDPNDEMGTNDCPGEKDVYDAQSVCRKFNIPFHKVNFVKEYWLQVFSSMLHDYQEGYTPNPDVLCNRFIKFDAFLKYSQTVLGADAIATGHYARHSFGDFFEKYDAGAEPHLLIPTDQRKDQTLFLSHIPHVSLKCSMFPLGSLFKSSVRDIALEAGLHQIVKRKESMGMCFIGKRKFEEFILEYADIRPGRFVEIETGKVLGAHNGIHTLTLGQNCCIGGLKQKYYVVRKDKNTQDILVAPGTNHPSLYNDSFFISEFSWLGTPPEKFIVNGTLDCHFRHSNVHKLRPCSMHIIGGNEMVINLQRPARAITPGQHAAFYLGDRCLGSGRIEKLGPSCLESGKKVNPEDGEKQALFVSDCMTQYSG